MTRKSAMSKVLSCVMTKGMKIRRGNAHTFDSDLMILGTLCLFVTLYTYCKLQKDGKGYTITLIVKSFLSFRKKQQPIGADDAERVKGKIGQVTSYNKRLLHNQV